MTIAADIQTGLVPACHGRAFPLRRGQRLRIVNKEGPQAIDLWAFNAGEMAEFMSMDHTRSCNSRITPAIGEAYMSDRRRPMLRIVEDTSPGFHDTLLCPCNRWLYEEMGCTDYHRNCADNLHEGLAGLGLSIPFTPPSLNLFMDVPVSADHRLTRRPPSVKPGDYLLLAAEMDLIIAISACPQDISIINGPEKAPRDVHYQIEG